MLGVLDILADSLMLSMYWATFVKLLGYMHCNIIFYILVVNNYYGSK